MKKACLVLTLVGAAALLAAFAAPGDADNSATQNVTVQVDSQPTNQCLWPEEDNAAPKATCFNCSKSSTGACKGKQQCQGSRSSCRSKGCKITGTSSCSTSANVKKC